jgi:hypothetical protein
MAEVPALRVTLVAAVVLSMSAATTQAADAVPPPLLACASMKKNSERLACYDQTVEHLAAGSSHGEVPTHSAEAMFGAHAAAVRNATAAPEREELTSVKARVKSLRHDASGMLLIELDNAQQWRQSSGSTSPLLEVGHVVTITRAALNSFRMSTPSGRALKVKRVQ